MFSGIAGFEKGIINAIGKKAEFVGFSEIDKYAISIYKKHFGGHKNYGNARDIIWEEVEDFDCLCGGFPCQSFSIAGKRGGFKDTRGTLFFEIARAVSIKRPKLLFLENVKGLLSHDNGKTFGTILSTLSELGYVCEWQVLNSKNFGVPQNRERVFIIGHLGEGSGQKIFPIGESNKETHLSNGKISNSSDREFGFKEISPCMAARDFKEPKIVQLNQPTHSNDRVYSDKGISPALNTMQGGNRQPFVAPVLPPNREHKRQNGRRFKENGEPSFTLTGQDVHGIAYDGKIRRLTPTECCRLQGFPDNWVDGISDSQKYKCLGNAVTVNVIQAIAERLFK